MILTMTFPANHSTTSVEQHCHRRRSLDRLATPALRLLKPRVACCRGRHFDAPTRRVPGDHLFCRGFVARRIERLLAASALMASTATTRSGRSGPHERVPQCPPSVRFVTTVNIERQRRQRPASISCGVGNVSPRLRGRPCARFATGGALYSRASLSSRLVKSQFFGKCLKRSGRRRLFGDGVKTLVFSVLAQHSASRRPIPDACDTLGDASPLSLFKYKRNRIGRQ